MIKGWDGWAGHATLHDTLVWFDTGVVNKDPCEQLALKNRLKL